MSESRHNNELPKPIEPLLTLPEVAKLLKVSERHISKLSSEGLFPRKVMLGRSVRYRPEDIRQFMKGDWYPDTGMAC